jgi:hypothetical protein
VKKKLERIEDKVDEVKGIVYDKLEVIRDEYEKLVGGMFEERSEGQMVKKKQHTLKMVENDEEFVKMIRYGMIDLRMINERSCKSMIVVKDGVVERKDVNVIE